ncbi:Glycine cleavage system transcriptional activator [Bradyrhizobium ivorense]|uniref:Glycine cleavage system transcriptional activator n=1 Tax=Bradyrhizobium ivorense TaxID=2511166 RepID=A0A508TBF1_9BRAD|nr:LysR family transcriptional regulator [Bradyrhizobium ivorense]VIO71571.1 Glycine cleavage system transcriptional activator [Bradyrhizobium ivorense]
MRKLPPLNAIRAFEAAARHESFTAAASELCVTVTAISHQVRQLEAILGRKLFERSGRAVVLTAEGHAVFPLLRDGFDRMASAFAVISPPAGGDAITVSTTRAFAERWLMPRLAHFNAAFPSVVVHIDATEDTRTPGTEGIDLAVRYGRVDRACEAAVLFNDRYIAVAASTICPPGSRLAIDEFRSRSLLAFRWKNAALDSPAWSAWLAGVDHDLGRDFRISWYSEEPLALHAAERGLGPLLCSDALVDEQLRQGTLRRLDGPALPGFAYRLVEAPDGVRRKSVIAFVDWMRAEAAAFRSGPEPVMTQAA